MNVLVADQFEQSGLDGLRAAGCDVVYDPALQDDALAAALADTRAQMLVVRSNEGDRRDDGRRAPVADRAGRRRLQHD